MTTYNGWTNYETWAVGMYLDGNYDGEATYRYVLDLVREHGAYVPMVADALRDLVAEHTSRAVDRIASGLAADLLGAAVSEVNWHELAEHKCSEIIEEWTDEARQRGRDDARAVASWTTDGNTEHEAAARLLQMAENGDPALDDYLPRRPSLSGEFADDPTPQSLAEEITGVDGVADEVIDALATAYDGAVSEVFEDACVAELRQFVGEEAQR